MTDMLDLSRAQIVNPGPDVRAWPVAATITGLALRADGVHIDFTTEQDWPDIVPPGWSGPLQYTLWLFLEINGVWIGSGIIQYWRGLDVNGGNVTADRQIARNWLYDSRWGAMQGRQPAVGERVGFLVSAGNARGQDDHIIAARSQVVVIPFPAAPQTFTFEATAPVPDAPPVIVPPGGPGIPAGGAIVDLLHLVLARLDALDADAAAFRLYVETIAQQLHAPAYTGSVNLRTGAVRLTPATKDTP